MKTNEQITRIMTSTELRERLDLEPNETIVLLVTQTPNETNVLQHTYTNPHLDWTDAEPKLEILAAIANALLLAGTPKAPTQ